MSRVLILTVPGDIHAAAVSWGLRKLGHHAAVWYWADFVRMGGSTITVGEVGRAKLAARGDDPVFHGPFDAVWYRRKDPVHLPSKLHEADATFVRREAEAFLQNAIDAAGHAGTRWVNPSFVARHSLNKVQQLQAARAAGLKTPPTVISNDPAAVRSFFTAQGGQIIYKPFNPGNWVSREDGAVQACTAVLTEADLCDETLRLCPGIYQGRVEKQYELRVSVFGDEVLTGRIDSQLNGASIDWRHDFNPNAVPLKAYSLPVEVAQRCVAVCRALNMVYGTIDLIVDSHGDHVFLEVNEGGQFLWKEERDPSLLMLDAMCRLLSGSEVPHSEPVRYGEFKDSVDFSRWLDEIDACKLAEQQSPFCFLE